MNKNKKYLLDDKNDMYVLTGTCELLSSIGQEKRRELAGRSIIDYIQGKHMNHHLLEINDNPGDLAYLSKRLKDILSAVKKKDIDDVEIIVSIQRWELMLDNIKSDPSQVSIASVIEFLSKTWEYAYTHLSYYKCLMTVCKLSDSGELCSKQELKNLSTILDKIFSTI